MSATCYARWLRSVPIRLEWRTVCEETPVLLARPIDEDHPVIVDIPDPSLLRAYFSFCQRPGLSENYDGRECGFRLERLTDEESSPRRTVWRNPLLKRRRSPRKPGMYIWTGNVEPAGLNLDGIWEWDTPVEHHMEDGEAVLRVARQKSLLGPLETLGPWRKALEEYAQRRNPRLRSIEKRRSMKLLLRVADVFNSVATNAWRADDGLPFRTPRGTMAEEAWRLRTDFDELLSFQPVYEHIDTAFHPPRPRRFSRLCLKVVEEEDQYWDEAPVIGEWEIDRSFGADSARKILELAESELALRGLLERGSP